MLKDLLLQFFLSVLPVFAFLLWHDKERGWNGFRLFITVTSGISMVLCLLTTSSVHEYEIDFRVVPYLIGSLYGGYRALAALTVLYAGLRMTTINNMEEMYGFLLYLVVFLVILLFLIGPFQKAAATKKEKIGVSIVSILLVVLISIIYVLMSQADAPWTSTVSFNVLMATIGLLLAVWLSIYIIEGVKEKQQLHDQVIQLSASYLNEVEKLQQFIDKAPIAVMIVDRDGRITHVNEESFRLLGMKESFTSVEELKKQPFGRVFQRGEDHACMPLLEQALDGMPTTTVPQMEEDAMLLYTTVTLRDTSSHEVAGAALIAQDVTELSQLRDELGRMERLSLVGQMAASITHEIRNPMAVIRGFVQLIQERSPQSQHEYFRIIMEELDRANLIISDFLSLAQNRELKMELASINTTINDLVPLLHADSNLRGQSLEVALCKDVPLMRLNDREIKQMLLNIARNGMEAMEEKGILRIKTDYRDGEISVYISDEGAGIPQDKLKHMFEPFFTTKTRGTGLGLPLCLSIAERHGGRIDVQTAEGQGTTFIVTFNITQEDAGHSNP
ncbi:PAS domain-containing protein [Paenibacillus sp. 1011MAR3C5]|uniref:two-component system sensor histidine kinase NtrB n=1 Tax=Paenibacillus sp. 1011MAR3C5 TaxID=1675787 RepID=UPI000E6B5C7F|nr:ATP-binding protein [Paenibacillus sp. 1011MAR3C5]RJE88845.1 PAS domain-containing protein [Paenibacillus sp. 1011MAR3C5]